MKETEIRLHWKRALEALHSSKILLHHHHYADAVSRAYYAIVHSARAALLVHEIIPKSHTHLRQSFGQYLVQQNGIEMEWAKILNIEYRYRTDADYMEDFSVTDEIAEMLITHAERFTERMKEYIESKGIFILHSI